MKNPKTFEEGMERLNQTLTILQQPGHPSGRRPEGLCRGGRPHRVLRGLAGKSPGPGGGNQRQAACRRGGRERGWSTRRSMRNISGAPRTGWPCLCDRYLPESSLTARAARYSLFGGGKRVRAVLVQAACETAGRRARTPAADFSAAVEMLHCYSPDPRRSALHGQRRLPAGPALLPQGL